MKNAPRFAGSSPKSGPVRVGARRSRKKGWPSDEVFGDGNHLPGLQLAAVRAASVFRTVGVFSPSGGWLSHAGRARKPAAFVPGKTHRRNPALGTRILRSFV